MSTGPYNVRYTLPNPILASGGPQIYMVNVSFLAVVSINDQQAFAAKTGTEDLNAAFNKWIPIVAVTCQNDISEAALMAGSPDALFAQAEPLASKIQDKINKLSEGYGLEVQGFKFETFDRPEDESARLRKMGLA
jgi:hypothetical protein